MSRGVGLVALACKPEKAVLFPAFACVALKILLLPMHSRCGRALIFCTEQSSKLYFIKSMWPLAKLCVRGRGHTTVREVEAYPVPRHEIQLFDSQENRQNCCHQRSDFKAKMHQIRFRLGLCPRPRYSTPQDLLAGF